MVGRGSLRHILMREGIRFDVSGAWLVGEGEVKMTKEQGPLGLTGVETLGRQGSYGPSKPQKDVLILLASVSTPPR